MLLDMYGSPKASFIDNESHFLLRGSCHYQKTAPDKLEIFGGTKAMSVRYL